MKTAKALLIQTINEWDKPDELDLITILSKKSLPFMEKAMEEFAKQQATEFVKWANENCWYKHYDQNDNCWTSRDEKRTETTEKLYDEFVLAVSPFSEKKYCR